jgi:hypothetical protein
MNKIWNMRFTYLARNLPVHGEHPYKNGAVHGVIRAACSNLFKNRWATKIVYVFELRGGLCHRECLVE